MLDRRCDYMLAPAAGRFSHAFDRKVGSLCSVGRKNNFFRRTGANQLSNLLPSVTDRFAHLEPILVHG